MSQHPAPRPPAKTVHIAEIEDPITGEVVVLVAPTATELDELIEAHTADPNTPADD